MAKGKNQSLGEEVMLDTTPVEEEMRVVPVGETAKQNTEEKVVKTTNVQQDGLINCLRNERVIVRHIPKQTGLVTDPKHILYGGMSENAIRRFGVPRLSSGIYVNVLTNAEKNFLEQALGLEANALSIHRKTNNYWDDGENNGISQVTLTKRDNFLDLSKPEDYIRYKILLANKDFIAPSLKALQDSPKATYQFVIINEGDEVKNAKAHMTTIQRCYKEFGKIEEDYDTLRVVVETLSGKPVVATTKIDWLQTQANNLIQADSKMFLSIVTDELLPFKVTIKKATEAGAIAYRGNQLYLRDGNTPLCEYGEEPTLTTAAKYLANPKHQDVLFALQAKIKN